MPVVPFRVDDRFVHGQILQGWLPSTRAQELFIANDALAKDDVQKMIMECAIPYNVKIVIDTVDEVARLLKTEEVSDIRRMVIVDTPVDALRLMRPVCRLVHSTWETCRAATPKSLLRDQLLRRRIHWGS